MRVVYCCQWRKPRGQGQSLCRESGASPDGEMSNKDDVDPGCGAARLDLPSRVLLEPLSGRAPWRACEVLITRAHSSWPQPMIGLFPRPRL